MEAQRTVQRMGKISTRAGYEHEQDSEERGKQDGLGTNLLNLSSY